jgi:hypothetical protein
VNYQLLNEESTGGMEFYRELPGTGLGNHWKNEILPGSTVWYPPEEEHSTNNKHLLDKGSFRKIKNLPNIYNSRSIKPSRSSRSLPFKPTF